MKPVLLIGVQRVKTRLRGQLQHDVKCDHHMTHRIAWTVNGNLRRQKNRRLVVPYHRNELTSGLSQSSYVVLALVVSLIHRTDWAKKRVLIVPRGVEGHGLVVGSVSFHPKGYIITRVAELVRVHESDRPRDDWYEKAVYWVDKHQDNIDTSCEYDSRTRYW